MFTESSLLGYPHLPSVCSCCLVVDDTLDSKNDKEEKTKEVADIRMFYFSCNFLHQGCELLQWWLLAEWNILIKKLF